MKYRDADARLQADYEFRKRRWHMSDLRSVRTHAKHLIDEPSIVTEVRAQRVVGALRATAACAKCHEVSVGTLLGAFSYTLVPQPAPTSGSGTLLLGHEFPAAFRARPVAR